MRGLARDKEQIKDAKINWPTVRRVITYAGNYKFQLLLFLLVIIADAIIAAVTPLILKQIIDVGIKTENVPMVIQFSLLAAAASITGALLTLSNRFLSTKIGQGVIFDLQKVLFRHLQKQPVKFFAETKTGQIINRINSDVQGAGSIYTSTISTVFSNVLTLVFTLIAMFSMSWQLTLVALLLVPAYLLPAKIVGPRLAKLMRESYDQRANATQLANERFNVSGATLAKTYGDTERDYETYTKQIGEVRNLQIKQTITGTSMRVSFGVVSAIALALIYGVGGVLAIKSTITVGTVVALAGYLRSLYQPITALSNTQIDLLTSLVSFERVFEYLDIEAKIVEADDAASLKPTIDLVGATVEFDHVHFGYEKNQEILHDLSFCVPTGKTVAIVGPSGAGKSTMSSLIPRLMDPAAGTVKIAGMDLTHATQESIKAAVGVVSQEAHMFHDTIAANLRYAKPSASEFEIVQALKDAYIWDMVRRLPDGIDTMVGESGYRLSGGERQRLAIARLLLKNPEIVILDEATAHLDSKSEQMIQLALEKVLARRTAIIIAHRLSTIQHADTILVMNQGKIVETGTHEQLLQNTQGIYAHLHDLQAS
jgi:ATP-binding cassette subfamily B protein